MTSRDAARTAPAGRESQRPGARRPRVYVHVGEPKTGTTFLQHVLWGNRPRLAARGILLPGYTRRDHNRASRDLREAPRPASDPADPWVGEWDVLTGQALRAPDVAVITDEVLAACTPPQADRAVRSLLPAEVHVVLTVRDFASLLTAEWQERVKCRGTDPWEGWLADVVDAAPAPDRRRRSWFWTAHDTLAILGMWSQHLPPDHVHVITVPRHGQTADLWLRFASVLGIDPSGIDLTRARTNSSLGLAEAEFLRRMNEALPETMPDWFYTRNIKRILAHGILGGRPGQARLVLPPGRGAWAGEQADILVAGLRDAKYDIVGDLGDLVPRPAAGGYAAPSELPPEMLVDAAAHAAAAMADAHYRQTLPVRQRQRLGPRQRISKLKWAVLNGPTTKRVLRRVSRRPTVRRLRVMIWCVLIHPSRHRRPAGPAALPARPRPVSAAGGGRRVQDGCSRRRPTRAGSPTRPGWTARHRR